jgi:hypothetical protein
VPQTSLGENLVPQVSTSASELEPIAERLADGPDHAEVADRRSLSARMPFADGDPMAVTRGVIGVGEAEDAGADDGDVADVLQARSVTAENVESGSPSGVLTPILLDDLNDFVKDRIIPEHAAEFEPGDRLAVHNCRFVGRLGRTRDLGVHRSLLA